MPKIYDDLKETIVVKAKMIIVSKGYSKLNMREVAKASGIAVGTVYNYFPTKDSLMSELMYRYWLEFIVAIHKTQQEDCELFVKFKKIYQLLESFLDTFKDTWIKLNGVEKGMTKEHYKQKQEVVDMFVAILEEAIKKHKAENYSTLKPEINDLELASFIVQNFMLIAQLKQFKYDTFELILKSYFL